MRYRSDIDGLRAVAVLPVILFHAGIPGADGGFIGVDIFFVISGYLITGLLLNDLAQGRYSIAHFYERRVRRILPALFLVIAVCIPFAWAWMLPDEFEDFAGSLSIVVFLSNFYFAGEVDYFNDAAELQPLLHTWSLAVEEQFYLFFPPLLALVWRFGRRGAFIAVAILTALSLVLALTASGTDPQRLFYFSPARFWEIGAGALCAFSTRDWSRRGREAGTFAGLLMILAAFFLVDRGTVFPGPWTVLPVAGAALILLVGGAETRVGRFLSLRPFVWIGLISYSAYLWHQPLFAFARIRLMGEPSIAVMLGLSAMSLGLAAISWRFVEQPFRRRSGPVLPRRPALFGTFAVLGAALLGLGIWGFQTEGLPTRLSPEARAQIAYLDDRPAQTRPCLAKPGKSKPAHPWPRCSTPGADADAPPDAILMGDSHMIALSGRSIDALAQEGRTAYVAAHAGCPAVGGLTRLDKGDPRDCITYQDGILDYAEKTDAPVIVIAQRWALYVDGTRFDNGEGGHERGGPVVVDTWPERLASADPAARRAAILARFEEALAALSEKAALVLVDPVPEIGWSVPRLAARCAMNGTAACPSDVSYDRYLERNADVLAMIGRLAERDRITRVRTAEAFCDMQAGGRCAIFDDTGKPLYFDDDHPADSTGAQRIAPMIAAAVRDAGR
ncbi:hypothetical protein ATO11_15545 [Pseudaestuariivita atlantica]|uniref:Acyltransferase n=2 Tax=Pseudaestuariivita atlantica TaxID=1317121 RepID=A0A0L1JMG5_9RHOB|nr:hypothetical protein ATO11_15545 [Pseudaestuariivita atlantica]